MAFQIQNKVRDEIINKTENILQILKTVVCLWYQLKRWKFIFYSMIHFPFQNLAVLFFFPAPKYDLSSIYNSGKWVVDNCLASLWEIRCLNSIFCHAKVEHSRCIIFLELWYIKTFKHQCNFAFPFSTNLGHSALSFALYCTFYFTTNWYRKYLSILSTKCINSAF